jgi:hypothetical protein
MLTKLKFLSKLSNNNNGKVWHRSFACSGIKYCEYYNPKILQEYQDYNYVTIEKLQDLQRMLKKEETN